MNIKDIVNRDIVNLTNCEQEPIHIPGSIQPHGFLLGLKEETYLIDFCSGNCADYTGIAHTEALGKRFNDVFGAENLEKLEAYISGKLTLSSTLLSLNLSGKDYLCTVHNSNGIVILEAEPVMPQEKNASKAYEQSSQFLNYMSDTHTLKELCELVAKGTREITGYDRVMVYRFDKDYNGEVFAESCREDLEPFLGLHYPHTDIPAQARQLYTQNLLRLITDIDYTPVPVYTVDDAPGKNLDLSLSILRSTSPIHVQYLHNMGVGATLTISLIYNKKLWGLIACHHYSPKNLSPEIRLAAQLQGHFITSQIDMRQAIEEYDIARKSAAALEIMNTIGLDSKSGSFDGIINQAELRQLCNASGVAIVFNNKVYKNGLTPPDNEIKNLASWLSVYTNKSNMHTVKLSDLLDNAYKYCESASGIIYHSLSNEDNDCIIWFRPETKTEVHWGGDPKKSIEKDTNGLSPRKSFELWKETVDCRSKEWIEPELANAKAYTFNLQRQINLYVITREEEKYRKLSELLKETNSELENINWISTHDLQEPLRKIQLISSRILSKDEEISLNVQDSIMRMSSSANRMQTLLVDILKYTRLKHTDESFDSVNLNLLMEEVKADLAESINEKSAHIIIDELPDVDGVPFLLKQLFSNLVANSIKYSAPDKTPEIKITSNHMPMGYTPDDVTMYRVIYVADNGLGFEQEYAESIFNIFTKLHPSSEYKGSGVGLALCKKIMQTHKGYITASSSPGVGTVISLYFPIEPE